MRENFKTALAAVLVHEGGYVNDPRDPGGATNKGITHRTYAAYQARIGATPSDVKHITDTEVAAIYKQQYWAAIMGDDLPSGLDYAVFDFAVNSGPSRAAKFLQRILGVADDGHIGMQTLKAIAARDVDGLIKSICANRLAWLRKLRHWPTFGKGWGRRVADVEMKAGRMARLLPSGSMGKIEPAQGKADGPITVTAAIKEAASDPKAVGGAVAVAAPSLSTILTGSGPVQYAIGAVLVIAALGFAFWLWQRGRADD